MMQYWMNLMIFGLVGSYWAWRIVWTPLPRVPERAPLAPRCPVYRLDQYQRTIDRRGRPQAHYGVKRLKR